MEGILKLVPILLVAFYILITSAFVMSHTSEMMFLAVVMLLSLSTALFLFIMKQLSKEKMLAIFGIAILSMGYSIWAYYSVL